MVVKLLTVFALGAIEIWASIPAGFALGLHPVTIATISAIGGMTGATAITLLGVRVREWLKRRGQRTREKGLGRMRHIWDRYGIIGLGLLAPLLVGAPLGTTVGITLGVPKRRLLIWMNVGVVIWSALLTAAAALGIAGVGALRN